MKPTPKMLEYLESFLTPQRKELFRKVIDQRTRHFTVATQDVYQLHNTSAVIRSCDLFGIQDIHIVEEINSKQIDREIAMGAQKWVTLHRYNTTSECLRQLRAKNYRIIATSPHKGSLLQDFDIAAPAAFFFGTETSGLSEEVLQAADGFLRIPTVGFTESLNISVSAAIILQELTLRLRQSTINWQLSEQERLKTGIDWAMKNLKNPEDVLRRYRALQ